MSADPTEVRHLLRWASTLVLIVVVAILLDRLTGCGPAKSKGDSEPAPTCDGAAIGSTRETACEGGKIVAVCTAEGFKEAVNTCTEQPEPTAKCDATKTTFVAVQPILTRSCNGCHNGYDGFEKAKEDADDYLRRFKAPQASPQHMPKGGSLTPAEIKTFEDWKEDGFCETSGDGGGDTDDGPFVSFDATEQAMLEDLTDTNKVEVGDRDDIRYLVADVGSDVEVLKQAAWKALNSVSTERELADLVKVAPGIWRINIDDVGMDAEEWTRIEAADLVNIESQTSRGGLLKLLTVSRKPWLHVETFTDTVLRNAAIYYDLTETPGTFNEFTAQKGVDFADDLQDLEAPLGAFVGSPLSPHNRMVSVHESEDGYFWTTYDTGPLDTAEKNFFKFPLLSDVGGQLNAQFVAGEVIYSLPNGLHGYALFNAAQTVNGNVFVRSDLDALQNVAPVGVVRDFLNPVSAEISAGVSCFRCHNSGILPFRDQVAKAVRDNGAQFGADRDLILAIYDEAKMGEEIAETNDVYTGILKAANIDPTKTDPISVAQDAQLLPWSLDRVCAKLSLRKGDCRVLLNQSETVQSEWGQLFSGGSITFEQFTQSLQQVIVDLRLFQDPL